ALSRWLPLADLGRRLPMVGPSWENVDEQQRMHQVNATVLRGLLLVGAGGGRCGAHPSGGEDRVRVSEGTRHRTARAQSGQRGRLRLEPHEHGRSRRTSAAATSSWNRTTNTSVSFPRAALPRRRVTMAPSMGRTSYLPASTYQSVISSCSFSR